MFCSKCGFKLDDAAAFCSACGAQVSGSSTSASTPTSAPSVDTEQLETYIKLAMTAVDAANKADALQYANKALEIAPEDYRGWLAKAKATSWGSTLNQNEVPTAIGAAKSAVGFAPPEMKTQIADECFTVIKSTIVQLLNIAQSMPMAMVPGHLNAFTHVHTVMMYWIQLVSEVPNLSSALIAREFQDCQTLCKQSKSAIMPGKRKVYAAAVGAKLQGGYDGEMKRALINKGINV